MDINRFQNIETGCTVHIVHDCLQHAMDTLPICMESIVVKIYKFFYIYTVSDSELKEFRDFADVEYKQLLQQENTKFLWLLPSLERVLRMFEALKSYFNRKNVAYLLFNNVLNIQHKNSISGLFMDS